MNSMVEITDTERKIAERIDPNVTRALKIMPGGKGLNFANLSDAIEFAKTMSLARIGVRKHLRNDPGACLAIVVQAIEWGMSPYAVASKSYSVNDQIAFEAQLIQAVILNRAPIKGRIKFEYDGEGLNRRCRAFARLRDEPDEIVDYESPAIKDIPIKNSPLWKGDPDQQLSYYAGRALCRRHFPDVILGIYTPEELQSGIAIGPDQARDVTPQKDIASRLDALATSPGRAAPPAADHDPETAEVEEEESDLSREDFSRQHTERQETTDTDQPATPSTRADPEDPAKTALMEKLATKAKGGTAALRRALAGLVPVQNEMLSAEDHDALGDIAEEADKTKGAA